MKLETALKKVTSLPGVQATFVFDQLLSVVAKDMPGTYSNDVLKRIARQLYQTMSLTWESGVVTQEVRLVFDRYAVFVRLFAQNYFLAVFVDKSIEPGELRQPINLATLVLEKALRTGDAGEGDDGDFSEMASRAEKSLREGLDEEASFVGAFRKQCFNYLGLAGRELVDNGIDDLTLVLPLRNEKDMRALADYVVARIPHILKQQVLKDDVEDLVRHMAKTH